MTRSIRSLDDAPGALAILATRAPDHLADDILVEVGLVDRMAPYPSPIGSLWIAWNGRGIAEVELAADGAEAIAHHESRSGRRTIAAEALPARLANSVARRLGGERRVRIPLDLRGRTAFEVAVWTKALEIPAGEVRPYGWIAAEIGRPRAVRAVGTALGHNPVPLIVPCHRVVRTDGTIGQYSLGGPGNKRTILATEGLDPDALEDAARRGERLSGSTTHPDLLLAHLPPCAAGPGPLPGVVPLAGEAGARGYRPCKVCRPARRGGARPADSAGRRPGPPATANRRTGERTRSPGHEEAPFPAEPCGLRTPGAGASRSGGGPPMAAAAEAAARCRQERQGGAGQEHEHEGQTAPGPLEVGAMLSVGGGVTRGCRSRPQRCRTGPAWRWGRPSGWGSLGLRRGGGRLVGVGRQARRSPGHGARLLRLGLHP